METVDEARFLTELTVLAETFGETLTPPRIEGYARALADLGIEEIAEAISLAARSCRFFPKPAELRELIEGTPSDIAAEAWAALLNAYHKAGFWTSVLFQDGAIATAVEECFGTWALCSEALAKLSAEMLRAKQKELF